MTRAGADVNALLIQNSTRGGLERSSPLLQALRAWEQAARTRHGERMQQKNMHKYNAAAKFLDPFIRDERGAHRITLGSSYTQLSRIGADSHFHQSKKKKIMIMILANTLAHAMGGGGKWGASRGKWTGVGEGGGGSEGRDEGRWGGDEAGRRGVEGTRLGREHTY